MAAAAVTGFVYVTGTESEVGWPQTLHSTTQTPQWTGLDLNTQLALISRQWLLRRTHQTALGIYSSEPTRYYYSRAIDDTRPHPETIKAVTLVLP
ncbi:hypothetical protein F5B21DRAFT_422780 [Xylaria acuta]|nr:hypothetical protein F5B21DRAFT_422780 [Xylaria acuta]